MTLPLDYPNEMEIRWMFAQGIPDTAMLGPPAIRAARATFLDGNTFDFDAVGERVLIFVVEDIGADSDLVAWQPRTGQLATFEGIAFALGQDAIWNPASYFMGAALQVHADPLAWLKADRDGVCILQPKLTYACLRSATRLSFADPVYAQQVKRWLRPPKSRVKILVEVQKEEIAA
jgi:hypothetical protein